MSDALWELASVTLAGSPAARLSGLTLTIHPGVTAVIGYSGAGKTSLLNLLAGFERPDQGEIRAALPGNLDGPPLFWVPPHDGLWPHLSVREHLTAVAPANRAESWLEQFDLTGRAHARPAELSQGERSRLSVARALAASAAVLVMDEPLIHVDPARADRYWSALRAGVKRTSAALVFATHDPRRVLAEADRVIALQAGKLLYEGPVAPLYDTPATPELAECLGEFNWLGPDEGRLWLAERNAGPCLRPERITIRKDDTGKSPVVVRQSSFRGSIASVEVRHETTNAVRHFLHRPPSDQLQPGDRVWVRVSVLLLALTAMLLAACGRAGGAPLKIDIKQFHAWQMPPQGALLPAPRAVAVGPDRSWLVIDTVGRVLNLDRDGKTIKQWAMPDASVGRPEHLLMLHNGRILVPDTHYFRLVFFDKDGSVVHKTGKEGDGPQGYVHGDGDGEFMYPISAEDDKGNYYVCEYGGNDRIQKFSPDDKFLAKFGSFGTGPGQFQRPMGLVWHDGKIYVADAANNRVQVFDDSGKFLSILGEPDAPVRLEMPYDIALAPDNTLLVVEYTPGRITRLSLDGKVLGRYGAIGAGEGQFATPWGIAIDERRHALVADTGNRRLVELAF